MSAIMLFLGVLFVLILVHEWGHYITAKLTGMKVEEFGIGFPPKLFGVQRGETTYTINALPIGGFVKILEENGVDESTQPQDKARAFGARPKWAQALVLVAGVVMNVLFAWLLFVAINMIGVQVPVSTADASPEAQLLVQQTMEGGPADGLLPAGVQITSITSAGESLSELNPEGLVAFVNEVAPQPVDITYVQNDTPTTVVITPVAGLLPEDPERYLIGVRPVLVEQQSFGILAAAGEATDQTIGALQAITVGLFTLIGQSLTGTADYTQVAGPVGIVGMVGDAAAFGLVALLTFTAVISLNLAIINLLPLPALDGGRLVFVAIEALSGRNIPPEWSMRLNLFGFAVLMLLMVAVTYNDIVRLL